MPETELKDAYDYNTRLVFTHWDPAVYTPYSNINDFILEIIWASLQYGRIYLRDLDLALNKHLAEMFLREESKGILERLLETGFVRIHTMRPDWYPAELKNSPLEKPIAARAEYVEKYSTYKGIEFKPNENQKRFYKKLDGFLEINRENAIEDQPDYEIPTVFRKEFFETVSNGTNQNALLEHPAYYGGLTYRCLDDFARYADNPEYAKSEILKSGQKVPKNLERLCFSRSLGYQCSFFSKYNINERTAIQRLLQSIFAKVYCHSISSDGRYSELLPETMIKIKNQKYDENLPLRVETVKGTSIKIDRNTFLDALIQSRKKTIYLRNPIKSSQETRNITEIKEELEEAANIFAEHYQENLPNSQLGKHYEMCLGLLGSGIFCVSIVLPTPYSELGKTIGGGIVVSIAKISECLRYLCRRRYSKQISRDLKQVIHARFVNVPLLTKPKKLPLKTT
jgi:hypothetical protein